MAVELEFGSYNAWPLHVWPHVDAGRNRSADPVSKSTVDEFALHTTEHGRETNL